MFVEWWMFLVFLLWWFVSVSHITHTVRKTSFANGVSVGTNGTLKILEDSGIICMDGELIKSGEKSLKKS